MELRKFFDETPESKLPRKRKYLNEGGERGRGKKIYQVRLSIKKYLRRSSSQVHRGSATVWLNHRMMRAAMKKMVVLFAKFAGSAG